MRSAGVISLVVIVAFAGCHAIPCKNNLPPAERLMEPGPGVGGPGPGVMMYQPTAPCPQMTSQMSFVGPDGMRITWDVGGPGQFDSEPLVVPGRYNFPQGAIYRLKLSSIPGRPGLELYPTLEVAATVPRTEAYLAHNAIPFQITEEDFDQVLSGNFVTKVIYLPDPEFQELALAGVETLVSTRLEPGIDPIVEADRRGAILAIIRLGNKDLQVPNGMVQEGGVTPASYMAQMGGGGGACPMGPGGACPMGAGGGCPMGPGGPYPMPMGMGGCPQGAIPNGFIAGMTAPQYGMPMCGTPIGLPGPPHVPLGIPAGLQRHTMVNHTPIKMPGPTDHIRIDVKQEPGFSYPEPANHARIVEKTCKGPGKFTQPWLDKHEVIGPECGAACPAGCTTACPITGPAASEVPCNN
jgi:hypothetical protein